MNNLKEEKELFFKEVQFSQESKQAIFNRFHKKRTFKWLHIGIPMAFVMILFFVLNSFDKDNPPFEESMVSNALTPEGAVQLMYDEQDEADQSVRKLLHKYSAIYQEDDALLLYEVTQEEFSYLVIYYVQKEGEFWQVKSGGSIDGNNAERTSDFSILFIPEEGQYIYVGIIRDEIERATIEINGEHVTYLFDRGGYNLWIGKAQDQNATVMAYKENGISRLFESLYIMNMGSEYGLPIVSGSLSQTVFDNQSDAMISSLETYMTYPLLLEKNEDMYNGNVVVIQDEGHERLVRIKGVAGDTIDVKNGSVIVNGHLYPYDVYFAQEYGDYHVDYTKEEHRTYHVAADEYFVQSDNWASSDFYEGVIKKEQIIGVVTGYALSHVTPDWTNEELELYNNYQQSKQDNLLVGASEKTVLRLYLLALTKRDYETAYALFDEKSTLRTFQDWQLFMDNILTDEMVQRFILDARRINDSEVNKQNDILSILYKHPYGTSKTLGKLTLVNGIYKVYYDQVTDISNYN